MEVEKLELRARLAHRCFDEIEIIAISRKGSETSVIKAMSNKHAELTKVVPGEQLPAFVVLDKHNAQILMNDLWDCGLRPSEGSGSAGAMAAVKYHLEDMRKLVFRT